MGKTCVNIRIGKHSHRFGCYNKMTLHDIGSDDSSTYANICW